MNLTKDADKLACYIYKAYLEKRKSNISKIQARNFEFEDLQNLKVCSKWTDSNIKATIAEISRAGLGDMYYSGGIYLNDAFIIYMENRFKNGLKEVLDFISNFIP